MTTTNKKQILIASIAIIAGMIMMPATIVVGAPPNNNRGGAEKIGYEDGKNDYLNEDPKNPDCHPYNPDPNPDVYCIWYKIGYEAGWIAASILY